MGLTVLCDGRSLNSNALPQRATLQKAVWKKKYTVYMYWAYTDMRVLKFMANRKYPAKKVRCLAG